MRVFEQVSGALVSGAERGPGHAGFQKRIHDADFHEVEESKRKAAADRVELTAPDWRGVVVFVARAKPVAAQPTTDASRRDARKTRRVGHGVDASVEEGCGRSGHVLKAQ